MQIKLKPGKPTKPGNYLCKRKGSSYLEVAHIFTVVWELGEVLMFGSLSGRFQLDRLEDGALFSERIDLIVED